MLCIVGIYPTTLSTVGIYSSDPVVACTQLCEAQILLRPVASNGKSQGFIPDHPQGCWSSDKISPVAPRSFCVQQTQLATSTLPVPSHLQ